MAKTKAKKLREKLVREGKYNPELSRLNWNGVNPVERKTPTIDELKSRTKYKEKWSDIDHSIFDLKRGII